jgi:hypothetical protein
MSAGCGNNVSSSKAKAGAISVTTSSGKTGTVTQLAILDTLQLSMTPSGDILNAGADWTITCGGNPRPGSTTGGGCGTLVPAHTADGAVTVYTAPSVIPINQAVTITATVTSNPSQTSSLTLTIVPSSIAISISVSSIKHQTVTTLQTSQSAYIAYTVVNDSLNAGVTWTASCGSSACGAFSSFGSAYTAPSAVPAGNGAVTLTATSVTDTSKSASVTLTIVGSSPPAGLTVTIAPGSLYLDTGNDATHGVQLSAFVGNDPNNAGVTWSMSCNSLISSACGSISSASPARAMYTAPSSIPTGGTVIITARSITNPSISNTATANIVRGAPFAVSSLSPTPPATLAAESSLTLAATTTDPNLQGVDWAVACASAVACGTFTSPHTAEGAQTTYTAPSSIPAGGTVTITASPTSTPSYPTVATITIVSSPTVSLVQTPSTPMTAGTQATVSATVANDITNSGVSWSVCQTPSGGGSSPSDCGDPSFGYVYPPQTASGASATYTAPPVSPGTSLVIQATSVAASNPSIQSGSIAVSNSIVISKNTTPSVSFIPSLPAKVQPNATINLIAAVANDSTTNGGVDWQLCGDGCGYFTIQPSIPAILATNTTPYQPPVAAVITTSVSGWPSGTPLPYTAPPQIPASGNVVIQAAAHVDNTKAVSGTIAIDTDATGPALNGKVVTGMPQSGVAGTIQPVAGSLVSLYVAGTNGTVNKIANGVVEIEYSVQATQIASTTTAKDGSFTIPVGYDCPSPSSQMYLVAAGGSAGTSSPNADLALMTALGSCSNLSSAPVVVNEVTTIASAFATGPFSANDALYGTSSYLYLGTSASNITGLVNAFAAVNNLVDITTGQTRFVTPAGNGTVPYAYINYLADILNACAITLGGVEGDGSACGTLLYGTDLLNAKGLVTGKGTYLGSSTPPADTLQAAFNFAQVARYNAVTEYKINAGWDLATTASPFQPIQALEMSNYTSYPISIHYTGGGISSASKVGTLATDVGGNVWITDSNAGTVAEWNVVGASAVGVQVPTGQGSAFQESPFTTIPGGGPMAIDANGNVWVSGDGKLAEITSFGTQAPGSPFKGVAGGGSQMAIDKQGNIWLANYTSVVEFDSTGAFVSPVGGYVNTGVYDITSVGVDSSNNVDIAYPGLAQLAQLTNPGGNLIVAPPYAVASSVLPYFAADGQGDMWETGGGLTKCPPYTGSGDQAWAFSCTDFTYDPGNPTNLGVVDSGGVALDGRGVAWVAEVGGLFAVIPPDTNILNGSDYLEAPAPSLAAGALSAAIDASGNIWVLLVDNSVLEFVGEATPVTAPVALGLQNKKLATMP